MTLDTPPRGTTARAAEVRKEDMLARGFRNPETRVVVNGKPAGFPEGAVIVSGTAPCGRIVRAGLSGPMTGCGKACRCVKEEG